MKKTTFVLFSSVCVLLLGATIVALAADPQCQIPNPSTKGCYDPNDRVASCDNLAYYDCSVTKEAFIYEINQFPDGTVKSSSGATKTESSKCWRQKGCIWNPENQLCEEASTWLAWRYREKIISNPEIQCPAE